MELKGERLSPASVGASWAALNDSEVLKDCIAGCDSLERNDADAFQALVAGNKLIGGVVAAAVLAAARYFLRT